MKIIYLAGFLFLVAHVQAIACGFCVGDKAASVYSYKNKRMAEKTRNHYVVIEIKGFHSKEQIPLLKKAFSKISAVDSKTLRFAPEQSAASFVYQKGTSFGEISRAFLIEMPELEIKQLE